MFDDLKRYDPEDPGSQLEKKKSFSLSLWGQLKAPRICLRLFHTCRTVGTEIMGPSDSVSAAPAGTAAGFHHGVSTLPYHGRPSARWNVLLSERFRFLGGNWVIIPSGKRERGNKRCERGRGVLMCFVVSDAITGAVM